MQNITIAIVLSGGIGKRFGSKNPKQFFKINGKTILEISVKKIEKSGFFQKIIIVSNDKYIERTNKLFNHSNIIIVKGGKTRQESVLNGLNEAKKSNPKNVVIHDCVRPFFPSKILPEIIKRLDTYDCVVPTLNINDSVRLISKDIYQDVNRENLKLIQTPQGFNFKKILESHLNLGNRNCTDDSIISYQTNKSND